MERNIEVIAKVITEDANRNNKNKRTLKYGDAMCPDFLISLKAALADMGWKVNKRGETLILTR